MKKILLVSFCVCLFFACDEEQIAPEVSENLDTSIAQEEQLDQEMAALKTEIVENLGLSAEEETELEGALMESQKDKKKPGVRWLVASRLNERLSDEKKARILARVQRIEERLQNRGHCVPLGFEPNLKRRLFPKVEEIAKFLTPDQRPAFRELVQSYTQKKKELIQMRKDDEISPAEFFAAMHFNKKEYIQTLMTEILTEKQRLRVTLLVKNLHEKKAQYIKASYVCMVKALGIDEETAKAVLSEVMAIQEVKAEYYQMLKDGDISPDEYLEAIKTSCSDYKENTAALLDDDQKDIVKLYRAISFHRF